VVEGDEWRVQNGGNEKKKRKKIASRYGCGLAY